MRIIEEMTSQEIIEELGKRSKMLFVYNCAERKKDSKYYMFINDVSPAEFMDKIHHLANRILPKVIMEAFKK